MSDSEIEAWKAKNVDYGLPLPMLEEMIAEANDEWTSELQYSPYDRYASLNVYITDHDETEGCFYLITVQRADWVFQGKALLETHWLFAQIPTVEVVVQVFKLEWTTVLRLVAYGYLIFNHTKEESCVVDVYTVEAQVIPFPPFTYQIIPIADNFTPCTEQILVSDAATQEETVSRAETVIITNS
ncbi:hypothetical protein MUP46_01170 [Patescibacteria group bacterium]|nr:hypothetical protein [Patescibacteria group bacterium]